MNMSSNLSYTQTGDYLLPNLTLHQPKNPLGKYGRMRLNFLKQQHPVLYHTMLLKPSHILLKVPHTVQNCAGIVCTSAQADCAETHSMVAQKCTPNQRNKNNLKDNHLIRANSAHLSLGEYQNVFLTEKEYKRLKADFAGLDGLIEQLSAYIQSTGKKYADHAATLRIWAKRQKTERKSTPGIPDYTFVEGESL